MYRRQVQLLCMRRAVGGKARCFPASVPESTLTSSINDFSAAPPSSMSSSSCVMAMPRRFFTNKEKEKLTKEQELAHYKPINVQVAEKKDSTIYTMTEYMEMEEKDGRLSTSLKDKASEKLDNPFWLLWGLLGMGIVTFSVIFSIRFRQERIRFDPSLQTVKVLDNDDGPQIGGPFTLTDVNGNTVTNEDLKGKWLYIYFGFINCPDICPEEMRKMSKMARHLDKRIGKDYWQPVFITVDPKRDTKEKLKEYLSDFYPRILGLTGTFEQTDAAARAFRVYYAIPDEPGMTDQDYLIDHSIVMYLMDPNGKFVDYTTKEFSWNESYTKLLRRMMDYERAKAASGDKTTNMRVANVHAVVEDTDPEEAERKAKERSRIPEEVPAGLRRIRSKKRRRGGRSLWNVLPIVNKFLSIIYLVLLQFYRNPFLHCLEFIAFAHTCLRFTNSAENSVFALESTLFQPKP